MLNRLKVVLDKNKATRMQVNNEAYLGVDRQVREMEKEGLPEEAIGSYAVSLHQRASWYSISETAALTINDWVDRAIGAFASIFSHEELVLYGLHPEPPESHKNYWRHVFSFKDLGMKEGERFVMGYLIVHRDPRIGAIGHVGITNFGTLMNAEADTAKLWMAERVRQVIQGEVTFQRKTEEGEG